MLNRNILIDRIMEKFQGTTAEIQEKRRQLYAATLPKLAEEFSAHFPSEDPYDLKAA